MRYKLANVPLENSHNMATYTDMYVRSQSMPLFDEQGNFKVFAHIKYDFATYLGSLSVGKWREYADLEDFHIHIDIPGRYQVQIVTLAYEPEFKIAEKKIPLSLECDGPTDIDLSEYSDCDVITFEIMPFEDTVIESIYYYTEIEEDKLRDIELSIAITTCKKEEYVCHNVALLDALMSGDEPVAGHLQVHVVDNGGTLDTLPSENAQVFLHANPNTGGAGGFARGMMESVGEEHGPKATNVLVMDDDVEVLPEAFLRTFNLLSLCKPEYHDAFISGAMLSLPIRNEQFEDVGHVNAHGLYGAVKPRMNMFDLQRIVENETIPYNMMRQYAAFWYCCIPAKDIEERGLPMPFFIRGDDAEYGMRDPNRKFMTMNGICVWHMSFGPSKFRANMECFYVLRNSLIIGAVSPSFKGAAHFDFFDTLAEEYIEREWRKFSYTNIELILDGVEAFLDGPAVFVAKDCEKQFLDYGKRNPKSVVLDFSEVEPDEIWYEPNRGFIPRAVAKMTKNGHRFTPKKFIGGQSTAPDDFHWSPNSKTFMKEKVVLVDDDRIHGQIHVRDDARFKELWQRYTAVKRRYRLEHEKAEKAWQDAYSYLRSPRFWKRYLADQQEIQDKRKNAK